MLRERFQRLFHKNITDIVSLLREY